MPCTQGNHLQYSNYVNRRRTIRTVTKLSFSTPFILAVLCIYFSYFLHGISVITLAQNMSSLAEEFSTDNAGIAYLISGIGFGRLISILFFGVISDKFGRRAVILMAVIMYLLFFLVFPLAEFNSRLRSGSVRRYR